MTSTRPRGRIDEDVEYARRGVATFGGGAGPTLGSTLREFVRRYGWRAYALPVLVVITIVALFTTNGGNPAPKTVAHQGAATSTQPQASSSPPVAPSTIPLKSDAAGATSGTDPETLRNSVLPLGRPYTLRGAGTFKVVPGTSKPVGTKGGTLFRYDIEVERGVTGVSVKQFANLVQSTLANPKSWSGHGVRVQRVDASSSSTPDFRVSLTSAMTVRKLCGYTIHVESSCYARQGDASPVNRVVLDVARWVRGARSYLGDLAVYRIYMINHEDGHAMGHQHAHQCLPNGMAPAMMQQTFGLKSATTGKYCTANPWPYPTGVQGAPGKEAQDTNANNEYYIGD